MTEYPEVLLPPRWVLFLMAVGVWLVVMTPLWFFYEWLFEDEDFVRAFLFMSAYNIARALLIRVGKGSR